MNKIAIVIPYYKIDFFEETIASVAMQTDKRFTLYIGNDASPDDPLPIIEKYFIEGSYRFFNYKENLGGKNLALQWERILENVEEEWFQILGDDDMISENFVEEFYQNIAEVEQEKINVIKVSQKWIDENNVELNQGTSLQPLIDAKTQFLVEYSHQFRASLSEHIFKKIEFCKYGFKKFPLAWHSDNLAVYETSGFSKLFFLQNSLVKVRMSEVNISNRKDDYAIKLYASHLYREFLIKRYYPILTKEFIEVELRKYREYLWKYNYETNIPLFKIYLKLGLLKKAFGYLIHRK
ncbi:glycosyltransferase family 2 protein [Chryseobacterium sp. NEB161]|nr:glycosyltransferase family 2 protein [Chryseobacterium sp. NEB161]